MSAAAKVDPRVEPPDVKPSKTPQVPAASGQSVQWMDLVHPVTSPSVKDRSGQKVSVLRADDSCSFELHPLGVMVDGVWKGLIPWVGIVRVVF